MNHDLIRVLEKIDGRHLKAALIAALKGEPETVEIRSYATSAKARIKAFLFEFCDVTAGAEVLKRDLHLAYVAWCKLKGFTAATQPVFGKQLVATEPGVACGRGIYRGVRLKT